MYAPVPGFAHILLVTPAQNGTVTHHPDAEECGDRPLVITLLTVLVEVAARQRPIKHVHREHYSPEIRYHLRRWIAKRPAGSTTYEINSLHTQTSGEFHGRVSIGSQQYAFTGFYEHAKISTFRLV